MDEKIDPNQWSSTELLKHLFREVSELKNIITQSNGKLDNYMATVDLKLEQQRAVHEALVNELQKQLHEHELKLQRLNVKNEESEKALTKLSGNVKLWIAIVSFILSSLAFALQFIF